MSEDSKFLKKIRICCGESVSEVYVCKLFGGKNVMNFRIKCHWWLKPFAITHSVPASLLLDSKI